MSETPRLDHENLDVYRCSIELLALTTRVGAALPRGEGELRDQLKRAAMSIPLNIAESCGEGAPVPHRRHAHKDDPLTFTSP
jgi:four helix bundle protein